MRHILRRSKNVRVELAEVTGFDLERRIVHASSPADLHDIEIAYDSLIVSGGATQSYFGHDELARYAPGMKTIDDALELRRRIFGAFEMAELALTRPRSDGGSRSSSSAPVRQASSSPVRCGSWRSDPSKASSRPSIPHRCASCCSMAARPLFATFGTGLSGKAATSLERLGVELRMGTRVTAVDVLGVDTTGPDGTAIQIDAFTGFGNRLSTMLRWLRSMIGRGRAEPSSAPRTPEAI